MSNWRNMKFNRAQWRAFAYMAAWLACVLILAILGEAGLVNLPGWAALFLLASAVPPLWYAYRVLPIEMFTLRDSDGGEDEGEEGSDVDGGDLDEGPQPPVRP